MLSHGINLTILFSQIPEAHSTRNTIPEVLHQPLTTRVDIISILVMTVQELFSGGTVKSTQKSYKSSNIEF